MNEALRSSHGTARPPGATRTTLAAAATLLVAFILAGCGEKETVVAESLPTASPSPTATRVIDEFRRGSGDELTALERDPDLVGFPGDADSAELSGSADLLALDSEAGPVTSSRRYGSFVLNLVTRDDAYDVLLSDAAEDPLERGADGIYWERIAMEGVGGDEIVNWIAHKRYGDVVLSRRSSERDVDSAFMRLDGALETLPGGRGAGAQRSGKPRPSDAGSDGRGARG